MTVEIVQLDNVAPVAANSNCVAELPPGPRYMHVNFQCSGTGLATSMFGKIEFRIGGTPVMEFADLDRLILHNAYYGRPTDTAANFSIYFDRAEMVDLVQRRMPGIGTADLDQLDVRIKLLGTFPGDGTVEAYVAQEPVEENLGAFIKIKEFTIPDPGTTGEIQISSIPRSDACVAIHSYKSDITAVRIKTNRSGRNSEVINAPKAVLERLQKAAAPKVRVPQTASATHVDFCLEGNIYDALLLQGLSQFTVLPTLGTTGAFDVAVEYVGGLDSGV